jgi:hypothetical protein
MVGKRLKIEVINNYDLITHILTAFFSFLISRS